MEPILMSLLIAYFLTKNVTQDLVYKSTGKHPPSYLRDEARRKAREERAERRRAKGDGPVKRFLGNELEQALADAAEKRNRARNKKRDERRKRWEFEDAEDAAYEENKRRLDPVNKPNPVKVPCSECGAELTPSMIAGYSRFAEALCGTCRSSARHGGDSSETEATPQRPHSTQDSATVDPEQPAPGAEPQQGPSQEQAPESQEASGEEKAGAPEPTEPTDPTPSTDTPSETPQDRKPTLDEIFAIVPPDDTPSTTQPDPAPADVIDINQWRPRAGAAVPEPIKEADMSGETPNLAAALTYTSDMANQAAAGAASVETSIASLQAGGVTGPALTALAQAQEMLNQAMAQFNAANAALTRHIQVRESYDANPDAGTKTFVTQD